MTEEGLRNLLIDISEAINMAVEAIDERDKLLAEDKKVGRWIPVSERLPENHKDVLICLPSDEICIGCYNSHKLPFSNNAIGWGASYVHNWCSNDVIAWMPLPKPYVPDTNIGKMSEIPTGAEVLDEIRADITDTLYVDSLIFGELIDFRNGKISADDVIEEFNRVTRAEVLQIIDKYKANEVRYENEICCNCTDEEIAKSFIEDVEAVKDLLPKTNDKCKECKKDWTKCTKCPVMMKWVEEQKVEVEE